MIAVANVVLITLALASPHHPPIALAGALIVTGALLVVLERGAVKP